MRIHQVKIFLFVIASLLLAPSNIEARTSQNEQHIEVSLRMIGHEVLLCVGDNTSRVLPIERVDERYKIKFDTDFQFDPEDLISTVNRVMDETKLDLGYILAVEACETGAVVYMYEMGYKYNLNVMPCVSRELPKACYNLVFTLLDSETMEESLVSNSARVPKKDTAESSSFNIPLMMLLMVPVIGIFVAMRRKRKQDKINPNLIAIGDYQFDKRRTELLFGKDSVELTHKEATLLMLLYDDVNTVMEREIILKKVWGDEGDYVGRTLDVFISKLRKKLESDPKVKIMNIRGVGYKLVISV